MPRKSRRVAARQAELSQRKKRGHGPTGIPVAPPLPQANRRDPTQEKDRRPEAPVAAAPSTSSTAQPARAVAPRSPYPAIGSELRRIAAITALILILLAALTFLLRG